MTPPGGACCYLLLPQDDDSSRLDGVPGGQVVSRPQLLPVLVGLPLAVPCGPADADVVPFSIAYFQWQLGDLQHTNVLPLAACFLDSSVFCSSRPVTRLVIDEQLDRVVAPLDQNDFVGLARNPIGERRSDAGAGTGLDPHAEREGVHLRQGLSDASVQVVGPLGERQLKLLR